MPNKVDPRLAEIFEYHFGIDITEPKYQEGLIELSDFFKEVMAKAIVDFYADFNKVKLDNAKEAN